MIIASLPSDESLRLRALHDLEILDTPVESDFNDLVALASQICNSPVSLITLLDKDRQWFKAKYGVEITETPRDVAFCGHAILQDGVFMVEDSLKDERFINNPLVTGEANVRFYAGAPILSPSGHKMGTLCVIDNVPRTLTVQQQKGLMMLSKQVTKLLEIRKMNIMMRQRAEEIITLKSNAIRIFQQETEHEKNVIAADLHEELAQQLASAIMYLKMAEDREEKRLDCVITTKQLLSQTLLGVRSLSYRISPHLSKWMGTEAVIEEYINQPLSTLPFKLRVTTSQNPDTIEPKLTLATIRIMEEWLKRLGLKKDISAVTVDIFLHERLEVRMEDNGPVASVEEREKEVFEHILFDSIQHYGGVIDLSISMNRKNVFHLSVPREIEELTIAKSA